MLEFSTQSLLWAAIFSMIVLVIFWIEYRHLRSKLLEREKLMKQRMYELAILRELGERIGYSLNVQKIIDIISGSLGKLLPYSTVAYMLPLEEEGRVNFHISLAESVSKSFLKEVEARMFRAFSALFDKGYTESDIEESVAGEATDPSSQKKVESFFNVPIVISHRPAGILTVASTTAGLYKTNEEVEILYTIVSQASEAVTKLETVLEIEKGKLNAMVASMADGILMVDTHNRLLVINPKTQEMLNLKNLGEPTIFDVLDAVASRLDLRTKIEESLKKDELVVEKEVELNNLFLEILISPVKGKKNEPLGAVVLFHDTTTEKELEKMREDFVSMMVHELRSPLTGIRSIASLLQDEKIKENERKYQEFLELISSNSNSMLDLVNDLLDVAKLESGKFEIFKKPSELKKVVTERLHSFASLALENKITFEEQILPEVPIRLAFDEAKIGQVLNNLLSNAIKFSTGDGGKVVVSAFVCEKFRDLSQEAVEKNITWIGPRHGLVCPERCVVVSVSNLGAGIPQSEMPKLFTKFQELASSTRSEKKGTGLGLVIVKGIVEAHGGQVGVVSEESKGATFYFTLPMTTTPLKATGLKEREASPLANQKP